MTVIGKHPYSFLIAGAGIVLILLALFARSSSSPQAPTGAIIHVSGGNTLIDPGISSTNIYGSTPQTSPTSADMSSDAPYVPIGIAPTNAPASQAPASQAKPSGTTLGTPPSTESQTQSDQLLQQVYALIPSGTIHPQTAKPRTPAQQALFDYGNEAGLAVLTFENAHADMAQVLQHWLDHPMDQSATLQVRSIADDMSAAGEALIVLKGVPDTAAAANQALAQGYKDAAHDLVLVAGAGASDTTLIESMKTYDAAADAYTRAYLALADVFSLSGVTFGPGDPGAAFVFSSSGAL